MADSQGIQLATNQAAGTTTACNWTGGVGFVSASATFGAGTIVVQHSVADSGTGTFVPYPGGTITANGGFKFELPSCQMRTVISGGTVTAAYVVAARIVY